MIAVIILYGCAAKVNSLTAMAGSGFQSRATSVCTRTGSPNFSRISGQYRLKAAINSSVSDAKNLVQSSFRSGFADLAEKPGGTYLALCFVEGSGRKFVVAEMDDAGDSAFVSAW